MCPRPDYAKTDPKRWERAKAARRARWIAMMVRTKEFMDVGLTQSQAWNWVEEEIMAGNPPWTS
jgi:hypothetical protein